MGDRETLSNPEEQYPLLKVDAGGDMGSSQPKQTTMTPGWAVTCTKKHSWFSRWPEFISACWMTLILFGISFLVFYALGMGAYRRQQFIIVKCNNSKPASNVFYHQIIKRGGQISFIQFSDYLAEMAVHYPMLRFNVYFLVDDYYPTYQRSARHSGRLITRFIPTYPYGVYNYNLDDKNKQAIDGFQCKYQNVNVTIMSLSNYMAMTPLRYKWKIISRSILPFYIRVFSVWENGGIGMDLVKFNNDYINHLPTDRKIKAVLKQHNDGINSQEYANALNALKIDKGQDNDFLSVFYGMLANVLNQTRSFINKTLYFPPVTESSVYQPLVRTHRSKREVLTDPINEGNLSLANLNTTNAQTTSPINNETNNQTESSNTKETLKLDDLKQDVNDSSYDINLKMTKTSNVSDQRQVLFVYDLSIVSDVGPPYILSDPLVSSDIGPIVSSENFRPILSSENFRPIKQAVRQGTHLLSLDVEGSFIAASSKHHPFLGHLISSEFQRVPKFAIQDLLLTQCSGFLKNDANCNNIYLL